MSDHRYPSYGAPTQPGQVTPMGDRQAPWPPPNARPAEPVRFGDFAVTGTPFQRIPLDQVWTLMPVGQNIATFNRQRPVDITVDAQSNVSASPGLIVQFNRPTAIFQITGSAVNTGQDAIVGDPRDTFLIDLQRTQGAERFTTGPALGSTIIGTGERPFKIAPNGWLFDMGQSLAITITPLRPDLRITINFSTAEVRGPANFTWGTVPAAP